jgi:hypothetical protein
MKGSQVQAHMCPLTKGNRGLKYALVYKLTLLRRCSPVICKIADSETYKLGAMQEYKRAGKPY